MPTPNYYVTIMIRLYQMNDLNACIDIFMSNVPKFFFEHELKDFQDYLKAYALNSYWVLEHKGKIVACGGIAVKANEGSLCFGLVHSASHKMGLGSQLLSYRIDRLREIAEVEYIRLDTVQHNPGFFEKFGFKVIQKIPNHYGPGLDKYEMRLDLRQK